MVRPIARVILGTPGGPAGPGRLAAGAAVLVAALSAFAGAPASAPDHWADAYRRGTNVSGLFTYPRAEGSPYPDQFETMSDAELARLARLGLRFIRLPVDPWPFMAGSAPQRDALFRELRTFVTRANAGGLAVMLSGYTTDSEALWRPDRRRDSAPVEYEQYARWLERVATEFRHLGAHQFALELMNEPQKECVAKAGKDWSNYQLLLHARLRTITKAPIVLTGGCWSSVEGLLRLKALPSDPRTLIDVHYYEPFVFTHQGATWSTLRLAYIGGMQYPPERTEREQVLARARALIAADPKARNRAEAMLRDIVHDVDAYLQRRTSIDADFDALAAWAKKHGIDRRRVIVGEFGAMMVSPHASAASSLRYLADVRRAAEQRGFGWAVWHHGTHFGSRQAGNPFEPAAVLRTLGLREH